MADINPSNVNFLQGGEETAEQLNEPVDTLIDEINAKVVTEEELLENQHGGGIGDVIFSKVKPNSDYIQLDSILIDDLYPEFSSQVYKNSPTRMNEGHSLPSGTGVARTQLENASGNLVSISPCGRFIGFSENDRVKIYKRSSNGWDLYINRSIPGGFITVLGRGAFTPDSKKFFVCSNNPNMWVIDLQNTNATTETYTFSGISTSQLPSYAHVKIHEETGNILIYGDNGVGSREENTESWILIAGGLDHSGGNGVIISRSSQYPEYNVPDFQGGGVRNADFSPSGRYFATVHGAASNVIGVGMFDIAKLEAHSVRQNYSGWSVKFIDERSFIYGGRATSTGGTNVLFSGRATISGGTVSNSNGPAFGSVNGDEIVATDIIVDGNIAIFSLNNESGVSSTDHGTNPRAVFIRLGGNPYTLNEFSDSSFTGYSNFFNQLHQVRSMALSPDKTFIAVATTNRKEHIQFPLNRVSKMPGYIDGGILTDKGVKAYVKAK